MQLKSIVRICCFLHNTTFYHICNRSGQGIVFPFQNGRAKGLASRLSLVGFRALKGAVFAHPCLPGAAWHRPRRKGWMPGYWPSPVSWAC
jgi:hypothetical protein